MTTGVDYFLVCNKHVESVLLWPEPKVVKHVQEFQMTLNPPRPGQDRTEDATYYKCELSRGVKMEKIRYRQEKSITPYQVSPKTTERFLSTLHVNLRKDGKHISMEKDHFKRGLEMKMS